MVNEWLFGRLRGASEEGPWGSFLLGASTNEMRHDSFLASRGRPVDRFPKERGSHE